MSQPTDSSESLEDARALAMRLYNETWDLLNNESRSARETDRMLHMAHASRFHWDEVGTDQNRAIGEWLVSRVHATLGLADSAVFHAQRAVEYAQSPGTEEWVAASAFEALAGAHAAAGDLASAREARDRSAALLEAVADEEDRQIVADDLASLRLD